MGGQVGKVFEKGQEGRRGRRGRRRRGRKTAACVRRARKGMRKGYDSVWKGGAGGQYRCACFCLPCGRRREPGWKSVAAFKAHTLHLLLEWQKGVRVWW